MTPARISSGLAIVPGFEGSAHVEFLRGIGNPIGMKCGPSLKPDDLLTMLDTLNPAREAGPDYAYFPLWAGQDRERARAAGPSRKSGRPSGRLVLRSDARQCHQVR